MTVIYGDLDACAECAETLMDCSKCGMETGTCPLCGTHTHCDCDDRRGGQVPPDLGEAYEWAVTHGAYCEALEWLKTQGPISLNEAWARCPDASWMLWALRYTRPICVEAQERNARLFACDCAERALLRESAAGREPDKRSWAAIEVARRFAMGVATHDELAAADAAAWAAWDAAWAARDAAWDAAWAAAWAARSAAWAARAAAGSAAWAAWDAAGDAADAAVRVADTAAGVAARVAAGAAERRWQADRLRQYFYPRAIEDG